jgi:hypothetical protein
MIPHISQIPNFTEQDRQTLETMRGSEIFLIVAKILAKEWHTATTKMVSCEQEDLVRFQGFAQGLLSIYNQLMLYANVDVPDKTLEMPEKQRQPLSNGKILRNMK